MLSAQQFQAVPHAFLPRGLSTQLDACAAPFQPSRTYCDVMADTAPLQDACANQRSFAAKRPAPVHRPAEEQPAEHSIQSREHWGRSRILRMELTEAARIEMHLQNLNVKKSSGGPLAAAPPADRPLRQDSSANLCTRPEGPDGEPIYEFANGMPGGVCVYFMKGYCSLGNRCRYVHDPSDPGHIVKITGMPYSATYEEVVRFFHPLEVVDGGVTFLHSVEGRPTGSAFVEFRDRHAALIAVAKDRAFFAPHRFVLLFASSKKERLWYLRNPQAATYSAGKRLQRQAALHTPSPAPQPPRVITVIRRQEPAMQTPPPMLGPVHAAVEQQMVQERLLQQQHIIQEQQQQIRCQQMLLQQTQILPSPAPVATPQPRGTPYISAVGSHSSLVSPRRHGMAAGLTPMSAASTDSRVRTVVCFSPRRAADGSPVRALLPTFDREDSSFEADSPAPVDRGAALFEQLGAQLQMQGRAVASLSALPEHEARDVLANLGFVGVDQDTVAAQLAQLRAKASVVHTAARHREAAAGLMLADGRRVIESPARCGVYDDMPPLVPADVECEDVPAE
eukprot:TRINITY_DN24548_c1_g1_i1.p2 TRINITY_DN24548_c1_g1~~TRINITY_DN24548_c1_g1_i1.p2  ORF type:complete len:605 (+),score=268.75 TRINITY_DN24548_c1_g1_i1:124-1815(+)